MSPPILRRDLAGGLALAALAVPASGVLAQPPKVTPMLAGKWMYRSYLNNPAPVGGDPTKAANDIFGEGVFTFATPTPASLTGTFDMGGGLVLDLTGTVTTSPDGVATFSIAGLGRPGTATAGWEYDYHGWPAYTWPTGINQVPSLVGSVLRAKPHSNGQAKAGFTASFIAVRMP